MNIEKLIPKETTDRDAFIRNIIIPDESINYIGLNFTDIVFRFKTNIPIEYPTEFIKHKETELVTHNSGDTWGIYTNDPTIFLPKEYLLEEWRII